MEALPFPHFEHTVSCHKSTKALALLVSPGTCMSLGDPRAHIRDPVAVEDLDSANVHAVAANSAGPPLLVM